MDKCSAVKLNVAFGRELYGNTSYGKHLMTINKCSLHNIILKCFLSMLDKHGCKYKLLLR